MPSETERFWAKVRKTNGGCWFWMGSRNKAGYGQFYSKRETRTVTLSHRYSFELHNGAIEPQSLHVLHSCDNPACVNPEHLYLGTNDDNVVDCLAKGRAVRARGQNNANSKLTPEAIRIIRREYVRGRNGTMLAERFGVSSNVIYRVVNRTGWRHVDAPLTATDREVIGDTRDFLGLLFSKRSDAATDGVTLTLDGIERDRLRELLTNLDRLSVKFSDESQLSRPQTNVAQRAHAAEVEGVCLGCGGRTINGTCLRNCDRD